MQDQVTTLCKCSRTCGTVISTPDRRGRPRRFAIGHHRTKRPDEQTLRRLYLTDQLGTNAIGALYDTGDTSVRVWLSEIGIQTRTVKQAAGITGHERSRYTGPDALRSLYLDEQRSPREIGDRYGVTANTVRGWIDRAGLPKRSRSEAKRLQYGKSHPSDQELRRMYVDEEMCGSAIAKSLGVDIGTSLAWLREAGVTIRSLSETQSLRAKHNPRKRSSDRAYYIPARVRYLILARDNFRCCACGRSPKVHGVVLHIDHVIPRSKGGLHHEDNLEALCDDCNQGKSDIVLPSYHVVSNLKRGTSWKDLVLAD